MNPVVCLSGIPNRTSSLLGTLLCNALPGNGQAGLECTIAEDLLPTSLAAGRWPPNHVGIKPDRQRSPPLQRFVIGRTVRGLVLRGGPSAHASQLSCWILAVKPSPDLCNKAPPVDAYFNLAQISKYFVHVCRATFHVPDDRVT